MPGPARIGLSAGAVVGAALLVALAAGQLHAVDLLLPGSDVPTASLIREDFGDVEFRSDVGFDGQQYYAIARHFPHISEARPYVDSIGYRSLRPVAPAVASLGGKGPPVVAIFVVLNLVGLALACAGLAEIAAAHGRPAAAGYLAAIPLLGSVLTSSPEALAYGLMLYGLATARRGQLALPLALCTVAAFTRETAPLIVAAVVVAVMVTGWSDRRLWAVAVVPLAAFGAWWVAVDVLIGSPTKRQLALFGFLDAGPTSLALTAACVAVLAWGAWQWRDVAFAWPVCASFLLAIPVLHKDNLGLLGLPRLAAPGLALGLAAIFTRYGARAPGWLPFRKAG